MEKSISVELNGLRKVSEAILEILPEDGILLFYGEMGVGKTTLIKNLCKLLQVKDEVSSPTFSLVNEYQTNHGETLYHFDFYRIKSEEEVMDMGYEDYFYSGSRCFVEWPEKIPNLLPENAIQVHIELKPNARLYKIISG